jgi:hypothetical protein
MVQFCTLLGLLFTASRKISMTEAHCVYSITKPAAGACKRERERELCWFVAIILVIRRQAVLDSFSTKDFQRNYKESLSKVEHHSSCITYKFYF